MNTQTSKQKYELIKFFLYNSRGMEFTGIVAMQAFRDRFGIVYDYHMFSDVLDMMHTIESAKLIGHTTDGMCKYWILP